MEQTVLVDQDNVVITATGMDESVFGLELKLLIENNSDTNLTFQVRNASVNGYMADTDLFSFACLRAGALFCGRAQSRTISGKAPHPTTRLQAGAR